MSTGFLVGKFAPLTLGHINFINRSSTKCDKLVVLLSYDSKWVGGLSSYMQKRLTLRNRLLWLKETYQDVDHIIIDFVDESDIPAYPNGWSEFSRLVKDKLVENLDTDSPDYVFSSESDYSHGFSVHFPATSHVLIDPSREVVPVSATLVRSDLQKNWEYLTSAVRKDFVYRVCVIGTESSGKTTLVKYLAKMFGTSWVEEYGRVFCEKDLYGDERLLSSEDYSLIAFRHKEFERQASRSANRVVFSDTNAFVTGFYQELYEGVIDPVVHHFMREEEYDLILYLDDDIEWVGDGLRQHGTPERRVRTKELFNSLLEEYGVKYIRISGNYEQRLETAYSLVKVSLGEMKEW